MMIVMRWRNNLVTQHHTNDILNLEYIEISELLVGGSWRGR